MNTRLSKKRKVKSVNPFYHLPAVILDLTRSFLPTKDLLNTRKVCKEWTNISDVETVLKNLSEYALFNLPKQKSCLGKVVGIHLIYDNFYGDLLERFKKDLRWFSLDFSDNSSCHNKIFMHTKQLPNSLPKVLAISFRGSLNVLEHFLNICPSLQNLHVRLLEHKPEFCIDFSKLRNLMILNIDREAKLIFKNRHYSQLKFLNIPSILGDVEQFEEGNCFQVSEAIGLYSDCTYIGKLLENLYHKRSKLKRIIIWCFSSLGVYTFYCTSGKVEVQLRKLTYGQTNFDLNDSIFHTCISHLSEHYGILHFCENEENFEKQHIATVFLLTGLFNLGEQGELYFRKKKLPKVLMKYRSKK